MREEDRTRFLANWGSQARKGTLELIVMSALARQERYGYELVERVRERCGLEVNDGTLYAILARLREESLIQHRWVHMSSGPARKYYSLTAGGRRALEDMQRVWAEIVEAVSQAGKIK
jgi:PadR family transcriptional regulator PadR